MQANDFDDLFAQQLGRLPAPDFSERDWREVENRLVIRGLQRKLTALTWALPLLGVVSLAMAGGLYHQLRQAHREIEELKKTTAAVVRRAAPRAGAPRPRAEAFDTLTQPVTATESLAGRPAIEPTETPAVVPGDAPLPAAPVPEAARRAPSGRSTTQPLRSISQPSPASESTLTPFSVENPRSQSARPDAPPSRFSGDVAVRANAARRPPAPAAVPNPTQQPERQGQVAEPAADQTPDASFPANQPASRERREVAANAPAGIEPGREFTPAAPDRAGSTPAETTGRTTWGENLAELKTLPVQPLAMEMDTTAYRKPLVAAARRTVPRYAPVETKGEIRRAGQRAPFRLSGLLDATSVGLNLGVPTGWGNGLPAGRGNVLGGQVGVRLTPRWQVFADVSSQRVSPERESPRPLTGIPVVRFADPDMEFVRFRINDLSFLNVGAGVNFVVTDRFALKPYVGLGYNLQVPKRYDVSYSFVKRSHRWPPQFPPEKEERTVTLRDRFEQQSTHQFRLQGGVRYPIQPNLNVSLEGFLNTQLRRLPTLTDTGGLRVGLSYEF